MIRKPIKRNTNIVWLSKDHHIGLLAAWKIRQGTNKNIVLERIKNYVQYFWSNHLQKHFYEEETILFNIVSDDNIAEALQQHKNMKALIEMLKAAPGTDVSSLQQFAETLEKHIRFEERIVFPLIEKTLTAEQLNAVGIALQSSHSTETNDDYEDRFWL